jgi:hypothetical protein
MLKVTEVLIDLGLDLPTTVAAAVCSLAQTLGSWT